MSRLTTAILAAVALTLGASAQTSDRGIAYEAEALVSVSTGRNTPFWLAANREGLGSIRRNQGYVRGAAWREAPGERRLTWGFGIDLAGAWRAEAPFIVRQLYGQLRYRDFMLSVGPRCMADTARLVDRRLSSGDLLFSGNSLPIPEARLEMPEYLDIPGLRHWIGVRAYVGYGYFSDSGWQTSHAGPTERYDEDVLFHAKGIFLRIGPPGKQFRLESALEMGTQFGGRVMIGDSVVARMPHGLSDFLKALIPFKGGDNAPVGEQTNVLGNHMGQWSARLRWEPHGRPWTLALHYLHYFDDHSMMFMEYPWRDGLIGIEYRSRERGWITGAAYEFLSTTDQSGPVYWDSTPTVPGQVAGRDDYYNHYIYTGWHHWGMGIANPLIISPVYNSDGSLIFKCTRLRGHHWAIEGQPTRSLGYRILTSYTRGWGTYDRPYRDVRSNVNLLVELNYRPSRLPGWSATLSLGADWGRLLGRSFGASLTITRSGILAL